MLRLVTESRQEITYISAYIHANNEIPTPKPMFSGSSNIAGQCCRLNIVTSVIQEIQLPNLMLQ